MMKKVIEAWMGFVDDKPHLYRQDGNGHQVFGLYIKKKEAKRAYEDVRKVSIVFPVDAKRS